MLSSPDFLAPTGSPYGARFPQLKPFYRQVAPSGASASTQNKLQKTLRASSYKFASMLSQQNAS